MARIRYQSLTLAGFGRYAEPTRFEIGGGSCTFTSANELGKSTFLAGLLATVFGPPTAKARFAEFKSKHRNWDEPEQFFGQIDLEVDEEQFRVRQDFDTQGYQVWNLDEEEPKLILEGKWGKSKKQHDAEPYLELLGSWFGFSERDTYEALFLMTLESAISARWQIDQSASSAGTSQAVDRLSGQLRDLYARFREITRNTKDFNVGLAGGARNGKNPGRLDEVETELGELEQELAEAEELEEQLTQKKAELEQLEAEATEQREKLEKAQTAANDWKAWLELEAQLRPAVASFEELNGWDELRQEIVSESEQIQQRLHGELANVASVTEEQCHELNRYARLRQELEQVNESIRQVEQRKNQLESDLAELRQELDRDYHEIRGRDNLCDEVRALVEASEKLDQQRAQLDQLRQTAAEAAAEREQLEDRLETLDDWLQIGANWESVIVNVEEITRLFLDAHEEFELAATAIDDEQSRIDELKEQVEQLSKEQDLLEQERETPRSSLSDELDELTSLSQEARQDRQDYERHRKEFEESFAEFKTAPDDLPALWDLRSEHLERTTQARRTLADHCRQLRRLTTRRRWRWALSGAGVGVLFVCWICWTGWWETCAAVVTLLIVAAVQKLFYVQRPTLEHVANETDSSREHYQFCQSALVELEGEIGNEFLFTPEEETRWRRMWPEFIEQSQTLEKRTNNLLTEQDIAELDSQIEAAELKIKQFDGETEQAQQQSEAEIHALNQKISRAEGEINYSNQLRTRHAHEYFCTEPNHWKAEPIDALPQLWDHTVQLAKASVPELSTIEEFVDWCQSLDDDAWAYFRGQCRAAEQCANQIEALQPTDQLTERVELLSCEIQQQQDLVGQLGEAVAPFGVTTDLGQLKERQNSCFELEAMVEELENEILDIQIAPECIERRDLLNSQLAELAEDLGELAELYGEEPEQLPKDLEVRQQLEARLDEVTMSGRELIAETEYDDLEALAAAAAASEAQVDAIRQTAQSLLHRCSELWDAVDKTPEGITEHLAELDREIGQAEDWLQQFEEQSQRLTADIEQVERDFEQTEIDALREQAEQRQQEREELESERDAIAEEFQESNRLFQELQRAERSALEGRITAYFSDFSRNSDRSIRLDGELNILIRNRDGNEYGPDSLSQGARDQLYFAVYLATTVDFDLPFLLDDPFVNCDAQRLNAIRNCWQRLTRDHQMILLSHNPALGEWADSVAIDQAA